MSQNSPFRIGVAGVGAIGKNHARLMADIAAKSGGTVQFTAIYDADPARAAEFAAQYGTHAASDISDFAQRVDAASVAVPTVFHRKVAEPLMQAGIHVMVEKPISESYAEAQALIELAKAKSVILQVGHIERFNPVLLQLEQRMDNPKFIEAHRLSPFPNRSIDIGVVLDLMIHDIEIVLHLVKSPLVQVDAVGIPVLTKREDIANARLHFASGAVANVTASRVSLKQERKLRIFQDDAYFSIDLQQAQIRNRAHFQEYFVQDDWRVSNGLTINAGLRYTLNFPSTEVNNQSAVFNLQSQQLEFLGQNAFHLNAELRLPLKEGDEISIIPAIAGG